MAQQGLKCLLMSPLATGADANSLAEYTGAEFGCVLWQARELYEKASRNHSSGRQEPGDEQLWLVDRLAERVAGTRLYALGLLRFACAEDMWQGESRLQRNFPRLYTKQIEEQQMFSIIHEQNNCYSSCHRGPEKQRNCDYGWDSSTDQSLANINPGKLGAAEAAKAVLVLTCTYEEHLQQSALARLQELRRESPPVGDAKDIWYVGSPRDFERGYVKTGLEWGPELVETVKQFPGSLWKWGPHDPPMQVKVFRRQLVPDPVPPTVRSIADVGLPLRCVQGDLNWQFPALQRRVATCTRAEEFWALCDERRKVHSERSRYIYDSVYILEEAARRHFHTCAEFLDMRQKIEHFLKAKYPAGPGLPDYLHVNIGEDTLEDITELGLQWFRENGCGELEDVREGAYLDEISLAELTQREDPSLWMRIEHLRQGFPSFTSQSNEDAWELQRSDYLEQVPKALQWFVEALDTPLARYIVERGKTLVPSVAEDSSADLSHVRRLLLQGDNPFSSHTLAAMQILLAQLNNCELRAHYEGMSTRDLISHASRSNIAGAQDNGLSKERLVAFLAAADKQWVEGDVVHEIESTIDALQTIAEFQEIIAESLGCAQRHVEATSFVLLPMCRHTSTLFPFRHTGGVWGGGWGRWGYRGAGGRETRSKGGGREGEG